MKKLRIIVLVREGLIPPDSIEGLDEKETAQFIVEYDVVNALKELGHEVRPIGVYSDLNPLREAIIDWQPHIVFMLLEEFHGLGTYDHAIVSYLELMRVPYTGCNPRGMLLSRDKALSKKVLTWHRVPTPRFHVFPRGRVIRRPAKLTFPLLVKSDIEDASLGISQASIVNDDAALTERVKFIHERVETDALVEQYIDGRELYVGMLGNQRLETLPVWEMVFEKMPDDVARIATRRVKWDLDYQKKHGIGTGVAKGLSPETEERIAKYCKRVYRALAMSGYARMDLRLKADGKVYIIEANANPNLEYGEDFAESADVAGIGYHALLQRIINLGLRYQAPWKSSS